LPESKGETDLAHLGYLNKKKIKMGRKEEEKKLSTLRLITSTGTLRRKNRATKSPALISMSKTTGLPSFLVPNSGLYVSSL